jgi:SOS response regulatory protein OraA/RecX
MVSTKQEEEHNSLNVKDKVFHSLDEKSNFKDLLNLAKRFLKVRDRASFEVRSFLFSKGITKESIDLFLEELEIIGLINDDKFLTNTIDMKLGKYGSLKLFDDFIGLGFEEKKITDVLNSFKNLEIERLELQVSQSKEKFLSKSNLKMFQYFLNKGFEEDLILKVFRKFNLKINEFEE